MESTTVDKGVLSGLPDSTYTYVRSIPPSDARDQTLCILCPKYSSFGRKGSNSLHLMSEVFLLRTQGIKLSASYVRSIPPSDARDQTLCILCPKYSSFGRKGSNSLHLNTLARDPPQYLYPAEAIL